MRFVLDTNVVVAAQRSTRGASAEVLRRVRRRRGTLLLSTPLLLEWEANCKEPKHRQAAGLSEEEVDVILNVLVAAAERVEPSWRWRPQLHDPGDEMVLEAAVNGRADALVTFNARDFAPRCPALRPQCDRPARPSREDAVSDAANEPPRPRAPTYPLRLPASLRAARGRLAATEGTSVNQFIALAVAEKVAALAAEREWTRRAAQADPEAFDRLMSRDTPEPEIEADRLS